MQMQDNSATLFSAIMADQLKHSKVNRTIINVIPRYKGV